MPRARFSFFRNAVVPTLFVVFAGCASAPKPGEFSARDLMAAACPANFLGEKGVKTVKGSIWTKIESKEMSGQFPATVRVEYPNLLGVEVTNLIGSPQAWLKIENEKTELRFTTENEKEYGKPPARSMLGGLPLELASRLFAGGVPCPLESEERSARVKLTPEGGVEVFEQNTRTRTVTHIHYSFTRYAGKPWVNEVRWEKLAQGAKRSAKSNLITIIREDPSGPDGAPIRWSASSALGEIRIRWKDRNVQ